MRDRCSAIVARCERSWEFSGWFFFAAFFLLPMFVALSPGWQAYLVAAIWAASVLLWLSWWMVDSVDREVRWWLVALLMLLTVVGAVAPLYHVKTILLLGPFILYQYRLRET